MDNHRPPMQDEYIPLTVSAKASPTTRSTGQPDVVPTFSGWRGGAFAAAICAFLSLGLNVGVACWLGTFPDANGGLIQVSTGDCERVHTINLWVHLGINAISTLLLGGSNYCMQCLVAPTREEINQAHHRGRWLDIGIPSLRNLRNITTIRLVLWVLLTLTSTPLHLVYNSVFYSSLGATNYYIFYVNNDFVNGVPPSALPDALRNPSMPTNILEVQRNLSTYVHLDNLECIRAYATDIPTEYRTLVIVTSAATDSNNSFIDYDEYRWEPHIPPKMASGDYNPYDWMCKGENIPVHIPIDMKCFEYIPQLEANAAEWDPKGLKADYCLAEHFDQRCSVNANLPIIIVVICCNAVKLAIMLMVALRLRGRPLITMGDAIESFLDRTDATTLDMCLLSKQDVVNRKLWPRQHAQMSHGPMAAVGVAATTQRWRHAASVQRWVWTVVSLSVAIVLVLVFLVMAIKSLPSAARSALWELGFGKVVGKTLISDWPVSDLQDLSTQIVVAILIANLPQLVLSAVYFNLNALLTAMFLGHEWNGFAHQRKTLRVSSPTGAQRSKHFLQLPYRAAVPMMVASGVLHWLVSQSIFLAVVDDLGHMGDHTSVARIATCGFSPVPMIFVVTLGVCILVTTCSVGQLVYKERIPLVSSCSAAIAAACHRPEDDVDAPLRPLQWGAVVAHEDKPVGHCAFTSHPVEPLQEGRWYAGVAAGEAPGVQRTAQCMSDL